MSIDVYQQLQDCLSTDKKSITIPAAIFGLSGPVFDAINQFLENQKLEMAGPAGSTITLTGNATSATVTGVGTNSPFGATTVTATFSVVNGSVEINVTATITPNWSLSAAWPGIGYPFSTLQISQGMISLDATISTPSIAVLVTVDASSYGSATLSDGGAAGLLRVTWDNGGFNFSAGFIVTTGSSGWNPLSALGIDKFTTISITEVGLFLTTVALADSDLAYFKNLIGSDKIYFLPSSVEPGLTALAGLAMTDDVETLGSFFTGKPTLELTAYVSKSGDEVSLTAKLQDVTLGAVTFDEVELEWDSSAETKKITLTLVSLMNVPDINMDDVGLCGFGQLIYSAPQSATFGIEIGACGGGAKGWVNPFFIQNLTIDNFGIEVVLSEEAEPALNLGGTITIGPPATAVDITAISGLTFDGDIPAPSGIVLALAPADKGKTASLADVISDVASVFGANFNLSGTFLNDLSIAELEVAIVQTPFTFNGITYNPYVSIDGDIFVQVGSDKYELLMILTVNTQADPPYMQACGTFNKNGGAITIDVGSTNVLTMSNVSGTGGPAACVDTLALNSTSDFCGTKCTAVAPGGTGYFLVVNAKIEVLSLLGASIYAKVAKDTFDFLMEFNWLGDTITTELACTFAPSESEFAAAIEFGANLPDLKLNWGFIGDFTIPAPSINLCTALGTFVPDEPVFNQGVCSGWTPTSAPYFYFTGSFSWGSLNWSATFTVDASSFQAVEKAFSDFGAFLLNWIETNVSQFLNDIITSLENLLTLLYKLGWALWDAAKAVYDFFSNISWDDVFAAAEKIWADVVDGACAETQAEAAYSSSLASVKPLLMPAFGVLAESEGGQEVLFHYYLHQQEIHELLRSDRESGRLATRVIRDHILAEQVHPTGRHLTAVLRALSHIAPYASEPLQASINEVALDLGGYQHLDHQRFVAALAR